MSRNGAARAVQLRIVLDDVALELPVKIAVGGQAQQLVADLAKFGLGAFAELFFGQHTKSLAAARTSFCDIGHWNTLFATPFVAARSRLQLSFPEGDLPCLIKRLSSANRNTC